MKIDFLKEALCHLVNNPHIREWGVYALLIILLLAYRKLRLGRWRKILQRSIDYHKYHLSSICKDTSMNEKNRELSQALLWAATKQLQLDIKSGKGGRALWRSFLGDKTALNTCGTVYYECAKNYRFIDSIVLKLADTLISTFYRIYLLESYLSIIAVIYMDFVLFISMITRPKSGSGRLYLEMRCEDKKF